MTIEGIVRCVKKDDWTQVDQERGGVVGRKAHAGTSDETVGKSSAESSADVAAVASLDEPTRRRIYHHVCARALPLSREEVTERQGASTYMVIDAPSGWLIQAGHRRDICG